MENLIEVRGLCKQYTDFALRDIDLTVPAGSIVGLIGENGAGKTTTLKAILGAIRTDGGSITLMGLPAGDPAARARVAAVFEDSYFYGSLRPEQIGKIMADICPVWDAEIFTRYCTRFHLPADKPGKEFSRGMRMKLSLATALARRPQLLILDEATSGLDPVVRGEVLDLLLEFIQDENHAVLLSSHITSDLEKVADQIAYIHSGKLLFQEQTDRLMEDTAVLRCSAADLDRLPAALVVARHRGPMGTVALVQHPAQVRAVLPTAVLDKASLDDMMQLIAGEEGAQ